MFIDANIESIDRFSVVLRLDFSTISLLTNELFKAYEQESKSKSIEINRRMHVYKESFRYAPCIRCTLGPKNIDIALVKGVKVAVTVEIILGHSVEYVYLEFRITEMQEIA